MKLQSDKESSAAGEFTFFQGAAILVVGAVIAIAVWVFTASQMLQPRFTRRGKGQP